MPEAIIKYRNTEGKLVEKNIDHTLYQEAADKKVDVPTLLMHKCADADLDYGTPFEQALLHSGIMAKKDRPAGMIAPSMKDVLSGNVGIDMNAVRAPDGTNNNISARMLFPQVILETMRDYLIEDQSDFLDGYNRMVALTENVASSRVDQPTIDTRANENVDSQQIAQLAEPASLVTITVGDTTHRIPTDSIGLMVSDDALEATSLDLVNLAMSAHARGKRIRMVENNIRNMVLGDKDIGMAALPVVTAKSFDSSITQAGKISRKAWIKWLRSEYQKRSLNGVMMSLDTAIELDETLVALNHSTDRRETAVGFGISNLNIAPPQVLIVDDSVVGAGRIVGLDTRYAIRRMVNVSASYEAIESFVLRKAKAFRVDHGEMSRRLYDEAWSVLDLTV
jgi:hypothetical protein